MPSFESEVDVAQVAPVLLKAIGFWKSNDGDPRWIDPRVLVDWTWNPELRSRFADYLGRGEIFRQYMGYSWCRFRCGINDAEMGTNEMTDGVWVWPAGLHHYVERHGIALPAEFSEEVASRDFQARKCAQLGEARVDWSFWGNWSLERRPLPWWRRIFGSRT